MFKLSYLIKVPFIIANGFSLIFSSNHGVSINDEESILYTLFGITIIFKDEQFKKANAPIILTPSIIATLFKLRQFKKHILLFF